MTEAFSSTSRSGRVRVYFEPGGEIHTIWDQAIFWILCGLILLMPLCLGAPPEYAWAETVFMFGAAAIGLSYAIKLITSREQALRWSWTYVLIGVFLLLVIVQMIPLPAAIVGIISPATLKLRKELMSDLPDAAQKLQHLPLTFYLENSIRQFRLLLSLAVIFVVVLNEFRRLDQIKRLLFAIMCIGGAIGLIALAQDITRTNKILWTIGSSDPNYLANAGPFYNHSHFSHFMNLTIGVALALALLNYKQTVRGAYSAMKDRLAAREYQLMFAAMGVIIICGLAVFLSGSGSGIGALAISGLLAAGMVAYKQRMHFFKAVALAGALIVICIAVVLAVPRVRQSLMNLTTSNYRVGERLQIMRALPAQWKQYPIVGTGLGAFEVVFPMFDVTVQSRTATHAENEYAQLMTETGAIGVAMALIFIAMLLWAYVRTLRKGSSDAAAIAIGLGYGVLAVLIQSLFDFGQHLPANALLMAVTCAMLLNLPKVHRRSSEVQQENQRAREGSVALRIGSAVALLGVFAWCIWGNINTAIAQDAWKSGDKIVQHRNWEENTASFDRLLAMANRAVDFAPRNVGYRHWRNVCMWYEKSSKLPHNPDGSVVDGPAKTELCESLIADLNDARWLCPTFAENYSQIGWYLSFKLERDSGAPYIYTAYRLSPNDPSIVLRAGEQEAFDGHFDRSIELLNRSFSLDPWQLSEVLDFYLKVMNRPDLALKAARGNLNAMQTLCIRLADAKADPAVIAPVEKEYHALLRSLADKPNASIDVLGATAQIERDEKNYPKAIELYRRVLELNYGAVQYRILLAQTLLESGDRDGALREAQICLRLQPHMPEAEDVIAKVSEGPARPSDE